MSFVRGVAAGAFAFTGQPSADDSVTIGDQTYVFKASVSTTANQVKIGANVDATIANLVAAVNKASGGGTTYGSATAANKYVYAAADTTNDEVDLTALVKGDQINGVYLAKSGTDIAVAAAVFSGVAGGTDGAGNIMTDYFANFYKQINSRVRAAMGKVLYSA